MIEAPQAPPLPVASSEWASRTVQDATAKNWHELAAKVQTALFDGATAPIADEGKRIDDDAAVAAVQAVQWLLAWHPGLCESRRTRRRPKRGAWFLWPAARRAGETSQIRICDRAGDVRRDGNVDERLLALRFAEDPGGGPRRAVLMRSAARTPRIRRGERSPGARPQTLADDNPFTVRVAVNRVWHHLFGRGIVPTVDNFGVLGQAPTHPELLDWLADRFRTEQKWSLKQLIKSIVLSCTYQMSSQADAASVQADPQNLLWHHMPVRRLQAESIRDAILAVSGRLDRTVQGAPVEVHLTQFMDGRGRPGSGPLDGAGRRSLYIKGTPQLLDAHDAGLRHADPVQRDGTP